MTTCKRCGNIIDNGQCLSCHVPQTSKHTPAPWVADSVFINNEANRLIIRRNKWGALPIADYGISTTQESLANAKI